MTNNIKLEQLIQNQAELIQQLRVAISRLEQKLIAVDKKVSRTADTTRKNTINIGKITSTIKNLRGD